MGFAKNFNYCMDTAGYSSYRFAKIIGVNLQSVSNWRSGGITPHPKTRQKIADHFGITLAELDGDELPVLPEQKESAPGHEAEGDVEQIVDFVRAASKDEVAAMKDFAAYLKSKREQT